MTARRTLLETVLAEPERFEFDAAVAVLTQAAARLGATDIPVRFRAATGLGFIAADVAAVEQDGAGYTVETGITGLTGPSGVLPRPYTELVNAERRQRSPALAAFLDLLAQRPVAAFAAAGVKYQPHRAARASHGSENGLRHALMALAGYGTPHLAPRLAAGEEPLLFYAGVFATHPRSADRLSAIVSDWLDDPVAVEQFSGAWLEIGAEAGSALPRAGRPGQFNQLGVDAAVGTRYWDIQSRVRLRLGPLSWSRFKELAPDQPLFARLSSLVRAYLGPHMGFSINPVLSASEIPRPVLGAGTMSRLGWNVWLPTACPRQADGTEAVFEADAAPAGAAA